MVGLTNEHMGSSGQNRDWTSLKSEIREPINDNLPKIEATL